jgi:hypothetical protein
MTAKELLELNGDFRHSPLLETARKLHRLLSPHQISYAIIGGLSVIRNGAVRTTQDIDILVRKEQWSRLQDALQADFNVKLDSAVDRNTNISVDILFAGENRDTTPPLPDPAQVLEYDAELQANFVSLPAILELKTAIYLQKKRDEGVEIAAKDLADVVALLRNNQDKLSPQLFADFHPRIRKELKRIQRKIRVRGDKKTTRGRRKS